MDLKFLRIDPDQRRAPVVGKYIPHQNLRERARRLKQVAKAPVKRDV
jgi:hypothetical protein